MNVRHREYAAVLGLLLFGALCIFLTYTRLSHSYDEAPHLGCGMQWWLEHRFSYEPKHPPLPRLMVALLPYLNDNQRVLENWIAFSPRDDFWYRGASLLHYGNYTDNLILARLGTLPFYLLAGVLVYVWARSLFGVRAALLSLALYATLPTVAAHAGVAATDMAHAAMLPAGVWLSLRWLKDPRLWLSVLLGVTLGLMLGSKMSAFVHYPEAMAMIIATNYVIGREASRRYFNITLLHLRRGFIVAGLCFFTFCALYFFDMELIEKGFTQLYQQNKAGHALWMFGPLHNIGVWYFFPVVYFFKTPIAFHIASVLSVVRILRERTDDRLAERLFPLMAAAGIFLISMPTNINVGVRHVLPVYVFICVTAGYGLLWLWESRKKLLRVLCVLLLLWQVADHLRAHPDRLSYFNELGYLMTSGRPEYISTDSDFDWGQGFLQLRETIDRRALKEMYGCFWLGGSIRDMKGTLGLAPKNCTKDGEGMHGWVAVSRSNLLLKRDEFSWLSAYEPIEKVGNTLFLYYLP